MQIKTTTWYHLTPDSEISQHHQKGYKQYMLERVCRKGNPPDTVGGNVIWCRHYGSTEVSQNIKNRISYNSTSRFLPKEYKNTSVKRYMLPYVHCSVIHKNQDTDATVSTVQFSRSVVSDSL